MALQCILWLLIFIVYFDNHFTLNTREEERKEGGIEEKKEVKKGLDSAYTEVMPQRM